MFLSNKSVGSNETYGGHLDSGICWSVVYEELIRQVFSWTSSIGAYGRLYHIFGVCHVQLIYVPDRMSIPDRMGIYLYGPIVRILSGSLQKVHILKMSIMLLFKMAS